MTGIEPAVYAGFVAIVTIMGIAWKLMDRVKLHVEAEVKPIKESLLEARGTISVAEGRAKLHEEAFNLFRLEVAKTYTTKEDVLNANKPVLDSVERLTHSVDNMNTRIDRVIEQSNAVKPASRRRTAE